MPVGQWIVRQACEFAASIRRGGRPDFKVAVNVFGAQFRSGDLMTLIASALDEYRLAADALELELTENIALQNDETIIGTVRDLAAMGVRVSFDDYGTGYASLSLLKRFPLASLKIDQRVSSASFARTPKMRPSSMRSSTSRKTSHSMSSRRGSKPKNKNACFGSWAVSMAKAFCLRDRCRRPTCVPPLPRTHATWPTTAARQVETAGL